MWGYIYENDDARAVYFIRWTEGHQERGAEALVSIGAWGDGTGPADRRAFSLECRLLETGPAFMLVDAHALPWANEDLGRPLARSEALVDALKPSVFVVLDRLVEDEPRFREFLTAGMSSQS